MDRSASPGRLKRLCIWAVVSVCLVPAVQAAAVLRLSGSGGSGPAADLAVVFPGREERIEAAVRLVAEGRARRLMVADQRPTAEIANPYINRDTFSAIVDGFIDGGLSRDTAEDALVAARRVRENGFRRVILVTSDYHMFRSWLLLRLALFDYGVEIERWPVPAPQRHSGAGLRVVGREMVKLWGSLCELTWYGLTGELLADHPLAIRLRDCVWH